MKVVYKTEQGVSVVSLIDDATNDEIKQVVPKGYKYKILGDGDLPTDRTYRDAWVIEDSELTDGVGQGVLI